MGCLTSLINCTTDELHNYPTNFKLPLLVLALFEIFSIDLFRKCHLSGHLVLHVDADVVASLDSSIFADITCILKSRFPIDRLHESLVIFWRSFGFERQANVTLTSRFWRDICKHVNVQKHGSASKARGWHADFQVPCHEFTRRLAAARCRIDLCLTRKSLKLSFWTKIQGVARNAARYSLHTWCIQPALLYRVPSA